MIYAGEYTFFPCKKQIYPLFYRKKPLEDTGEYLGLRNILRELIGQFGQFGQFGRRALQAAVRGIGKTSRIGSP